MIKSSPSITISNINTTPAAISLGLGDMFRTADAEQKALEAKLLKDITKTKASRQLFAAEAATKRLDMIWKHAEKKMDEIKGDLFKHNKKLETELKIHGTTDLVIMNSYGSILKDMKVSEITELARQGDTDAIRAVLLVPALKLSPKFKRARDAFMEVAEVAILGDDYEHVQGLREQQEQFNQLDAGMALTHSEYSKEIKRIKETVVAPEEMPVIA